MQRMSLCRNHESLAPELGILQYYDPPNNGNMHNLSLLTQTPWCILVFIPGEIGKPLLPKLLENRRMENTQNIWEVDNKELST